MHELSVAQSIMEIVCRHAADRRVTQVTVHIGHLRQVVPAALSFSFEIVAQGTPVEGAELIIEPVPAIGLCRRCGAESQLHLFPLQCQACDSFDLRIVAGEELVVDSLLVEEEEHGALSGEDSGGGGRAQRQ
ncbi:MAG TPA: hydrogenase maturation nickel metallochaperone HypA [Chloroflexota bacterium]|nr:hydrogenase maturation nickel metallochaperone HypA [Chloroflexota bacterium]